MPSFNRARLIDIEEKGLDPTQNHVTGPDGRLVSNEDKKEKLEKLDHPKHQQELQEKIETISDAVDQPTDAAVDKKPKGKKTSTKSS